MEVGTIHVLTKVLTLPIQWTLSSPNLIVTKPDGTQATTIIPIVSPDISISSLIHTFQGIYFPDMGGQHSAVFQFNTSLNSSTINLPIGFWVTWNDVYTNIRNLLGISSTDLSDSMIDFEYFTTYIELMYMSNNSLPNYWQFSDLYKIYLDQAMCYFVAARLRPQISGKKSTGEVTLFKKGTTTVQWSLGVKPKLTLEDEWIKRAMLIFKAQIPEIGAILESNILTDNWLLMERGDSVVGNLHPNAPWNTSIYGGLTTNLLNALYNLDWSWSEI